MPESPSHSTPRNRIRIFVDFWNYTLSMRSVDAEFRTDWATISNVLVQAAASKIGSPLPAEYQGLNFYSSHDPASERDRNHRQWATTVVDTFPGVTVYTVPRQRKRSPPHCPSCRKPVPVCPACGRDMRGTEEKGIDVRIATDMIKLAWVDNYDAAVLVSSDKDFIPVVQFLETRGIKVVHAKFPPKGSALSNACWGSIDVPALRASFRRDA